ncbi:MAG: hypothetical protein ACI4RI_07160 [Ruminococcus sp.]
MKKSVSLIISTVMVLMMIMTSVAGFSAADKLVINENVTASKGDTVTYSLYASSVPTEVEDLQMEIYYDSQYLKVVDDSVKYVDGGSSVYNTKIEDKILFNSANGVQGWDFSKKTLLFSVSFTVEQAGATDLTYYIQCMDYLENSQTVDEYVLTCDYLVNDKAVKKDIAPVVNGNGQGGNFVNYENGKGSKNGGNTPVGGAFGSNNGGNAVNNGNAANNGNNANNGNDVNNGNAVNNGGENGNNVAGQNATNGNGQVVTTETTVVKTNSSGVAVTTPDGEQSTWSDSKDMWRNIGIIALALAIVVCIVILVFVNKKKN